MIDIKKYFWNVLISIDQLANTLLAGDPDETMSSRMGKTVGTSKLSYCLCKALSLVDDRHCKLSIEKDEGRNSSLK